MSGQLVAGFICLTAYTTIAYHLVRHVTGATGDPPVAQLKRLQGKASNLIVSAMATLTIATVLLYIYKYLYTI